METLRLLAEQLREEDTPISSHVVDPAETGGGSLVIESVREGYLLHYGQSRLLAGQDPDLALLAGDYLYALAIERLVALGDAEAVGVLAELIGRCAQLHTEDRAGEAPELWRQAVAAIGETA